MTDNTKKYLISYGIFFSILIFMFSILFVVVYFTRNVGSNNIKDMLQDKIDLSYEDTYLVHNKKNISLPLNLSSYAFSVIEKDKNDSENFGTIISLRLTGAYGPIIGVFFQKPESNKVEYLGELNSYMNDTSFMWNNIPTSQINYWINNFEKTLKGGE